MIYLVIANIILKIGDAVSTYLCLKQNKGEEANPIVKYLFSKIGVINTLFIVTLYVIIVIILAALLAGVLSLYALISMLLFHIWLNYNNWKIYFLNK